MGTVPDPFYDRLAHASLTYEDSAVLLALLETAQVSIRTTGQAAGHVGSGPERQARWRGGAGAPVAQAYAGLLGTVVR